MTGALGCGAATEKSQGRTGAMNAGWDFSSPNYRFAWGNTPEERSRANARNKFALAIQRELMQRAEEGTPA